jgi:hypothetical protein
MTGRFIVAAATAVVGGITIVGLPFVQPVIDWPAEEPHVLQGREVVDVSGRVTSLDSQSVVVAPTVLGFNGRRFLLDEETRILVGDKEGGIGDLQIGANVAVIYEPRAGGLLARWLGVNFDREALRSAALRSETSPAVSEAPAALVPKHAASTTPISKPVPPPAPSNREGEDPGAVIDWLLRDAPGR